MDGPRPTLVGSLQLLSNVVGSARILYCPNDWRWSDSSAQPDFASLTVSNVSFCYVPNLMWQDVRSDSIVVLDRIHATAKGTKWRTGDNHVRPARLLDFRKIFVPDGGHVLYTGGRVEFVTELPSALKDQDGREVMLSP